MSGPGVGPVPPAGLLLTHGAGGSSASPALRALAEAAAAVVAVRSMDFPYRRAGRRPPDRAPKLVAAIREEAADFADELGVDPERLVLGGRSMGGRMCSVAVAEGLPARGLVLVSYPLHPPGRPDRQPERTAHFPALEVPCLFVSGTRDAFGSPDELTAATRAVAGPVTHVWLEGGDHGLRRRDADAAAAVREWLAELVG